MGYTPNPWEGRWIWKWPLTVIFGETPSFPNSFRRDSNPAVIHAACRATIWAPVAGEGMASVGEITGWRRKTEVHNSIILQLRCTFFVTKGQLQPYRLVCQDRVRAYVHIHTIQEASPPENLNLVHILISYLNKYWMSGLQVVRFSPSLLAGGQCTNRRLASLFPCYFADRKAKRFSHSRTP